MFVFLTRAICEGAENGGITFSIASRDELFSKSTLVEYAILTPRFISWQWDRGNASEIDTVIAIT